MPSAIFYPAVSADDGQIWVSGGNVFNNNANTFDNFQGAEAVKSFVCFTNVVIPNAATINSCTLVLTAYNTAPGGGATTIKFEDVDNAAAVGSNADWNSKSKTGAVAWSSGAWSALTQYTSSDLKTLLQTVVNRAGWISGNSVQIFWEPNFNQLLQAYAIDASAGAYKAELHVTYTGSTLYEVVIADGVGLDIYSYPDPESLEILSLSDIAFNTVDASINENINASDYASYDPAIGRDSLDALALGDSVDGTLGGVNLVAQDILYPIDLLVGGWVKVIADAAAIVEALVSSVGVLTDEHLFTEENIIANWSGGERAEDTLYFYELFDLFLTVSKSIADAADAADTSTPSFEKLVVEYVLLLELLSSSNAFSLAIADLLSALDSAGISFEELLDEAADIVCSAVSLFNSYPVLADSSSAADTSSYAIQFSLLLSDALAPIETLSIYQVLQGLISDGISLSLSIIDAGDLWQCWVLHSNKLNPSVFSNFNFNSFCQFNGKSFGMKSDGVYLLEGTTDAGTKIHPGVLLTASNFGSEHHKYFRTGFIGFTPSGVPAIKMEDENGNFKVYGIQSNGRVNLSRDISGRYITVALSDFDSLNFVELIPVVMVR